MLAITQYIRDEKAFIATTDLIQIAGTSETPLLYLKNPAGSGKEILVTHFKFGTDSATSRSLARVYANPTVSANGTALTPANTKIKASPAASVMEAYKSPTVTANGTQLNLDINPSNSHSRGVSRWYWIEPGSSILITLDNSVANVDSFADIYWLEDI